MEISWLTVGPGVTNVTDRVAAFLSDSGVSNPDHTSSSIASTTTTSEKEDVSEVTLDTRKKDRRKKKSASKAMITNESPTVDNEEFIVMSNEVLDKVNASLDQLVSKNGVEPANPLESKDNDIGKADNVELTLRLGDCTRKSEALASIAEELHGEAEKVLDACIQSMSDDIIPPVVGEKKNNKKKKTTNEGATSVITETSDAVKVTDAVAATPKDDQATISIGFARMKLSDLEDRHLYEPRYQIVDRKSGLPIDLKKAERTQNLVTFRPVKSAARGALRAEFI